MKFNGVRCRSRSRNQFIRIIVFVKTLPEVREGQDTVETESFHLERSVRAYQCNKFRPSWPIERSMSA